MLQHCIDAHQLPTLPALHSHGASHHLALHSLGKPRHSCHACVLSGGRVSVNIPDSTFPKQGIYSQHVLLLGSLQTMTINNTAHAVLDLRFDSTDQVNDRGCSGLTETGNLILIWNCMLTKHCNPSPFRLLSASCFWPLFRCP